MKIHQLYSDVDKSISLRSWCPSERKFIIGPGFPSSFDVYDGDTDIKLELHRKCVEYTVIGNVHQKHITIRVLGVTMFKLFLRECNEFEQMFLPTMLSQQTDKLTDIILIGDCCAQQQYRLVKNTTVYMTRFFKLLPDLENTEILKHQVQIIDISIDTILSPSNIELKPLSEMSDILTQAKETLQTILTHHLKYYFQTKLLTFVNNFIEPADIGFANCIKQKNTYKRIIQELNLYLEDLIYDLPNVFLLDINNLINCIGKQHLAGSVTNLNREPLFKFYKHANNDINYNHTHFLNPLKINLQYKALSSLIYSYINYIWKIVNQKDQIKLVIFDLDNTLWRGFAVDIFKDEKTHTEYVIGEKWFRNLWCYILQSLKSRGIFISISSKNDFDFIQKHFDKTFSGLIRFSDFVFPKINYNAKSENIKNTIQELHLTPESVLFVDDNPLEREEVKLHVPGIRVVGQDGANNLHYSYLPYLIYNAPELQRCYLSKGREVAPTFVDGNKQTTQLDKTAFLNNLNLKLTVFRLTPQDQNLQRVVDLTNKTNQFNTTGKRRTLSEVFTFLEKNDVFYFTLNGIVEGVETDYDIIGVAYVVGNCIEQFLMSCRVLGLEVETNIINFVIERVILKQKKVYAHFTKTKLNTPCIGLYTQLGFLKEGENYILPDTSMFKKDYTIPIDISNL